MILTLYPEEMSAHTWTEDVLTQASCPTLFRVGDEVVVPLLKIEAGGDTFVTMGEETLNNEDVEELILDHEYACVFTEGDEVPLSKDSHLTDRIANSNPGTTYIVGDGNDCFAEHYVLVRQDDETWLLADTSIPITSVRTTHLVGVYYEAYPLT